jgi:hypothetical protein
MIDPGGRPVCWSRKRGRSARPRPRSGDTFLGEDLTVFAGPPQFSPDSAEKATFQSRKKPVNEEKVFTFAKALVENDD